MRGGTDCQPGMPWQIWTTGEGFGRQNRKPDRRILSRDGKKNRRPRKQRKLTLRSREWIFLPSLKGGAAYLLQLNT